MERTDTEESPSDLLPRMHDLEFNTAGSSAEESHQLYSEKQTNISVEQPRKCPIANLSTELLTLILDILRESYEGTTHSTEGPDPRGEVPVIASHVCGYWRSVALENPLWWSEIIVMPPVQLDRIAAYLERSKQCILDIQIFGHRDGNDSDSRHDGSEESVTPPNPYKEYQVLFNLLYPHLQRCRTLQLSSLFADEQTTSIPILQRILYREMPHLEKFVLEGDYDAFLFTMGRQNKIPLFLSNPVLRDLRLTGIQIDSFVLPPASLARLHLSRSSSVGQTTFATLKGVLEALPNIEELAIYDDLLIQWPGSSESCHVPSLRTLAIYGNMLSVSELLMFLDAPKVKTLTIAPVVVSDMRLLDIEQSTNRHFRLPFPELYSLTLAPAFSEAFTAVDILATYFPQVKELVLANLYATPFLKLFTNEPIAFPNLTDLALTDLAPHYEPVLQQIITFRNAQNVPLRNIFVDSKTYAIMACAEFPGNFRFRVANVWEEQRRQALHSEVKDMFVGRSYEDS
ncbi:hypothetical protein CPC08DRAFT_712470 [Agrocybe pediades]|nr:hypothetical protein CPC08DRAFT_712470 [Agrocybe pediades]